MLLNFDEKDETIKKKLEVEQEFKKDILKIKLMD